MTTAWWTSAGRARVASGFRSPTCRCTQFLRRVLSGSLRIGTGKPELCDVDQEPHVTKVDRWREKTQSVSRIVKVGGEPAYPAPSSRPYPHNQISYSITRTS